jgi:hypothetical protein
MFVSVSSFESFWTGTEIAIDAVSTSAVILTRIRTAVVNIDLAVGAFVSFWTGASILVDSISASAAI